MSAKSGDKARHEKNRKRVVLRRMKVRAMLATEGEAPAKRRAKPPLQPKQA
jgi:hypothetical protein